MVAPECISLLVSQKIRDPGGGGALKLPPPSLLRSQKLLYQSSPYHACAFAQVHMMHIPVGIFSRIRGFDHFTTISKKK